MNLVLGILFFLPVTWSFGPFVAIGALKLLAFLADFAQVLAKDEGGAVEPLGAGGADEPILKTLLCHFVQCPMTISIRPPYAPPPTHI